MQKDVDYIFIQKATGVAIIEIEKIRKNYTKK